MLSCLLNGERINCYDGNYEKEQLKKWATKKILLCPACGKPYEYCHGKVKSPYFRHMDKSECEDRYSEPETEEHITGKKDLYNWVRKQPGVTDCELEGWFPATKQRPDIMFKYYGKQYVLEYQCSPIATEYVERHELYQAAGIKDIWVAGYDKYFKENARHKFIENHIEGYYNPKTRVFIGGKNTPQKEFIDKIFIKKNGFMLDACIFDKMHIIHKSYYNKNFDDLYALHLKRIQDKRKEKEHWISKNEKLIDSLCKYVEKFNGTFGKNTYYTNRNADIYYLYINNGHYTMKCREVSVEKKDFYKRMQNIKRGIKTYINLHVLLDMDCFNGSNDLENLLAFAFGGKSNKKWRFHASDCGDYVRLSVVLLDEFYSSLDCSYELLDGLTQERLKEIFAQVMEECVKHGFEGNKNARIISRTKEI